MSDTKELFEEALGNIRDDRKKTSKLLSELKAEIKSGETDLSRSGVVAAKYLESLQRSNEQLVKMVTLLAKNARPEDLEFSEEEKNNIFEIIQGTGTDE
tara:strand:- start:666 stop:962 length:297 start_codon:yes stop_codon:yes gene_type:complete